MDSTRIFMSVVSALLTFSMLLLTIWALTVPSFLLALVTFLMTVGCGLFTFKDYIAFFGKSKDGNK